MPNPGDDGYRRRLMRLQVTEEGTGEDLVVLIHGVLDRARSFDAVVDILGDECRLVRYDRRGYGQSVDGHEAPGVAVHVEDLLGILDGRPAVLVGHSFGGVLALGAAVRAPEVVRSVVLYETGLAWVPGWDDTAMQAVLSDRQPEDAALRLMLGDRFDELDEGQKARRRIPARAFLAEERSVRTDSPPFDTAEITAPVVYGRSDPAMLEAVVKHLETTVPALEVVTVEGADHHAHRNDPTAFAGLVRRGLRLSSSGS